jgi:hypothetical protein
MHTATFARSLGEISTKEMTVRPISELRDFPNCFHRFFDLRIVS